MDPFFEHRNWEPLHMFGGPVAAPAAAPVAPAQGPPSSEHPLPFAVPGWCVAPQASAAKLLIWRGAALQTASLALGRKAFFLAGRLADCDLVLDQSASRHHAAILHHRSGSIYLLDLGSAQGTFLGNERLPPREPRLWADGVACVFGASALTYVLRLKETAHLTPPMRLAADAVLSGGAHGDAEDECDATCEANTRANICIPVTLDSAEAELAAAERDRTRAHRRQRRAAVRARGVTFDPKPPSIRVYEPPSPEAIHDPEGRPPPHRAAASAPPGGELPGAAARASASPPPAPPTSSLPRPRCSVSIETIVRGGAAKRPLGADGSATSAASGMAAGLHGRLSSLYRPDAATATASAAPAAETIPAEGSFRSRPRGQIDAARRLDIVIESSCGHTAVWSLLSSGAVLAFESTRGASLLQLHFAHASLNPMGDGRALVRYQPPPSISRTAGVDAVYPPDGLAETHGVNRSGLAAAAPRNERPLETALSVSVVNPQPCAILVYIALCTAAASNTASSTASSTTALAEGETPLSPWDPPAAAEDEMPQPLRVDVAGRAATNRGANCLQLAALEGTPACTADGAEGAPFGESNTFRYVAATGAAARMPSVAAAAQRPALRVEASYQISAGGEGGGRALLGAEEDDLVAEAPFLVAVLPLGMQPAQDP